MKKTPLTSIEKDYINLYLEDLQRKRGKITPLDFEELANKMNRETETIKRFADKQPELVKEETAKPSIELTHTQRTIRDTMAGKTAGGRDSVTIMSEGASAIIDDQTRNSQKKPSRHERNIYRGNK